MGRWDQWKTTCPGCNGGLVVTELTLTATGEKLSPNTELQSDGFEFDPDQNLRNLSTENEVVKCIKCGRSYDLADLALDK